MADPQVTMTKTVAVVKPEPTTYDKKDRDGNKTGEKGYIYYAVFADGMEASMFDKECWEKCKELTGAEQEFIFSTREYQGKTQYTIVEIPGQWKRKSGGGKGSGGGGGGRGNWVPPDPAVQHAERLSIEAQVASKNAAGWAVAAINNGFDAEKAMALMPDLTMSLHKAMRDSAERYPYVAPPQPKSESQEHRGTASGGGGAPAPTGTAGDLGTLKNTVLAKFGTPRAAAAFFNAENNSEKTFAQLDQIELEWLIEQEVPDGAAA